MSMKLQILLFTLLFINTFASSHLNWHTFFDKQDFKTFDIPDNIKLKGGYITDTPSSSLSPHKLFYYFTRSLKGPKAPLVIWYSGGPGFQNGGNLIGMTGPIWASKHSFEVNKVGWYTFCNHLIIDWPFSTGFSETDDTLYFPKVEDWLPNALRFIERFTEEYNELTGDIWYAGDSSTGMWGPELFKYVLENLKDMELRKRFKGVI